ncbi:hypothetical protein ACIQPR_45915 [Streptomyces sp. NPDC091280]|uniref:hypothetical protein n=1 Tax=Streptomyces sp. NPDC091280 TaxID=3365984 RepID=UPI0038114FA3
MPVEFLTDEQAEAYGKFVDEPTRPELERFFFLERNRAITVDMGYPAPPRDDTGIAVTAGGRRWPALGVDMGNPHAVAFVDDLAHPGDLRFPPVVTPVHAYPDGVTVEFALPTTPQHLTIRIHERGVGEPVPAGPEHAQLSPHFANSSSTPARQPTASPRQADACKLSSIATAQWPSAAQQ